MLSSSMRVSGAWNVPKSLDFSPEESSKIQHPNGVEETFTVYIAIPVISSSKQSHNIKVRIVVHRVADHWGRTRAIPLDLFLRADPLQRLSTDLENVELV